jgi:hypothetical protein
VIKWLRDPARKTQVDLIRLVTVAGWGKGNTPKEWRWYLPSNPGIYYTLRDAADLVRPRGAGVAKQELQKGAGA